MKGERKIKKYLRYKFEADKIWADKRDNLIFIESVCFIGEALADLQAYCKTHGLFFWVDCLDGRLLLTIMEE